ncbi:PilW family protein [Synechococcus elongatus]|uniref:Prepilin-type N-terminal cleavage/methylation domain-containing protein n=1 Tax=Synechococcus elongatus (strain ATCC 33912 / PCC 7942 / FACHB-805) TaxID=1140 RepID=Q31JZ8_SYNE7|nr:hypothetical protein [Synechococcus elongatus]ABB58621.1 conserved hypothetical protein [Synechococcus elongatus PCC 7942 = FACHB-805]AJD56926.1 hypothetical protein M744_03220 [Synechococcus elongatus UTEX 2973]MBD2587842.1 hypothetical protein [Synechococcus elongatus FACHB-242]MBD2688910.1 hypothetical protein [Synechococcus elongatus FACHB-1061]MBD2707450.1 hypothetical protein [Synechococcus elongatus PCC 7942 = FACHB-805]
MICKGCRQNLSTAGFTVSELLVSGLLGLIIVLAGGFVLKTNLSSDRRAAELAKQRNQLGLALDFMSSEMRQSRRIVLNADLTATAQCNTSTRKPILSLEIPRPSGGLYTVTYAVQAITPQHIWQGPHAIYRCGPSFNSEGRYTENSSQFGDLLIDGVANQVNLNTTSEICRAIAANRNHTAAVQADLSESQRLASIMIGVVSRPNRGEQQVICDSRLATPRS